MVDDTWHDGRAALTAERLAGYADGYADRSAPARATTIEPLLRATNRGMCLGSVYGRDGLGGDDGDAG
jgi:hypothetical protein